MWINRVARNRPELESKPSTGRVGRNLDSGTAIRNHLSWQLQCLLIGCYFRATVQTYQLKGNCSEFVEEKNCCKKWNNINLICQVHVASALVTIMFMWHLQNQTSEEPNTTYDVWLRHAVVNAVVTRERTLRSFANPVGSYNWQTIPSTN